MKPGIFLLVIFCCNYWARAQTCSNLGQTPFTAFPVCGTNVFHQTNVPYCQINQIFVPGCDPQQAVNGYLVKNPYFYKFTAYQSGPLSFTIKPLASNEDYDWQLFDVTGHAPDDIITDKSLVVIGNWSGTYGTTGASSGGVKYIQCASDPRDNKPTFAKSPQLIAGHNYILLISHFSDTPSGYDLVFTQGTLIITDTTTPALKRVTPVCGGQQLRVKLNKKLKCSSLANDGSDFSINGPAKIISASAPLCSNGFDMDTILVNLDKPLPSGTYTLSVQVGTDGNTLLDYCDGAIVPGNSATFTVNVLKPAVIDSITPLGCSPSFLNVFFTKPVHCSSLSAGKFLVSGPTSVTITDASGTCNNDITDGVRLTFQKPLVTSGIYTLHILPGVDGTTILDECGQQIPANNIFQFTAADTVNANFSYAIQFGCSNNAVQFSHNGFGNITRYNWIFSQGQSSAMQNPLVNFKIDSVVHAQLSVSNGVCSDTAARTLRFTNYQNVSFTAPLAVCPNDPAIFVNTSIGDAQSFQWNFGNGNTSSLKTPPMQYYLTDPTTDRVVSVSLTSYNSIGCADTATKKIQVSHSCFIAVPSAFTPNGDGLNDFLYPLVAYKALNLVFNVYNRYGQLVFHSTNWQNKWDGRFRGRDCDTGAYVWTLSYTDSGTGKKIFQKGSTILIR